MLGRDVKDLSIVLDLAVWIPNFILARLCFVLTESPVVLEFSCVISFIVGVTLGVLIWFLKAYVSLSVLRDCVYMRGTCGNCVRIGTMYSWISWKGTFSRISSFTGSGELGSRGTMVFVSGGDGCFLVTMVEDIMGLDSGSSIIRITLWFSWVVAQVRGSVIDIGWGLIILVVLNVGDTLVLGFLVETSYMKS